MNGLRMNITILEKAAVLTQLLIITSNQLTISVIFSMHEICVNLKCLKSNMYINNNVNEKDFVLYLVL